MSHDLSSLWNVALVWSPSYVTWPLQPLITCSISIHIHAGRPPVVSCPSRACLPARNGLVIEVKFLGLIPQKGGTMRLQDHCSTSLTTLKFIHLHSSIRTFFERVFQKIFWTLLGYTVAKAPASSRNLTWFTRPLLLVRGWGLGTRLGPQLVHFLSHMTDHEVKHGNHQAYFMQKVIKEWTGNKFTVLSPVPSPSTNTTFHSTQEQGNTMEPCLTNTPQQQTHTI